MSTPGAVPSGGDPEYDAAEDARHFGQVLREAVEAVDAAALPNPSTPAHAAYLAVQRLVHAYQALSLERRASLRTGQRRHLLDALAAGGPPGEAGLGPPEGPLRRLLDRVFLKGESEWLDESFREEAVFDVDIESDLTAVDEDAPDPARLHAIVAAIAARLGPGADCG